MSKPRSLNFKRRNDLIPLAMLKLTKGTRVVSRLFWMVHNNLVVYTDDSDLAQDV